MARPRGWGAEAGQNQRVELRAQALIVGADQLRESRAHFLRGQVIHVDHTPGNHLWRYQVHDRYTFSIAQTAESCQDPWRFLRVPVSSGGRHVDHEAPAVAADALDDPDYPAYTIGRAADALGVQQAYLRALDTAGALTPVRSGGGHRRYTRRQLALARRIRELLDQGHNLGSSLRILALEDELAAERDLVTGLRDQLRQHAHEQRRKRSPGLPDDARQGRGGGQEAPESRH